MIYYIYIPTGLNTPMLEILLAEAQSLIQSKKKVEFILFKPGQIFACSKNIFSQKFISLASEEKIKIGLKRITGEYKVSYITNTKKNSNILDKINFKNPSNVKKFKYQGIDFGNAIYSSYVGLSRDAEFDGFLKTYSLKNLLNSSLNIFFFFRKKLQKNSKIKVILYNGRHNESRPIVRYCVKKNIPVNVMEFSGDGEKSIGVRRFINHLPTDLKKMERLIKNFWKKKSTKDNKCDYYFKYKRAGRVINDRASYILRQKKKLLPDDWDKNAKNIVYFTSSQDEYSCLGGIYDQTIYKNQNHSIVKIVNDFKKIKNKKYNLFIRCHPYLKDVFWKYNKDIIKLHDPKNNIFIVEPASPVSSYEMLLNADKIITYNSQTGIEAVYWEKPSIILGRRVYENLNCVYKPVDHKDVMRLILKENLKPKSKLGSLIYASYWVDGGFTYNSFTGSMKSGYKFKKNYIINSRFIKFLYLYSKVLQYYFFNYIFNYQLGKIIKL